MANNKMLIDASHPEETRVVVLRGNRVEEFDFESASKKQLRGNIYLAKVTRVEPSLQAAFVEYGGNRHGFLAFSEIHPDYYQIPVADRQALLEDEARAHAQEEEEERGPPQRRGRRRRGDRFQRRRRPDEAVTGEAPDQAGLGTESQSADVNGERPERSEQNSDRAAETAEESWPSEPHDPNARDTAAESVFVAENPGEGPGEPPAETHPHTNETAEVGAFSARIEIIQAADPLHTEGATDDASSLPAMSVIPEPLEASIESDPLAAAEDDIQAREPGEESEEDEDDEEDEEDEAEAEEEVVEQIGGDEMEELPRRPARARRHYKIQEVIKRRQILLVQVVKEERGSKGAALTTYLSLAGRYSVLMPNTARGGGISRKITDAADRKRLKEIAQELEPPEGMGVILRTAGASRTVGEVKRDFEYLLRMWESVRELTLKSTAPSLVYEEGSLIKRSIRDLYSKEIDEVIVAGDAGYQEARDYMRMLMPSHEKAVQPWREPVALFAKYGVEAQLDSMFSNIVTLRSGGYLVINQAEALVAIDVNSGRSTREHNIEDTALRTNCEAADEVARQLRLRDLAGLIVVDFIDMEEHRNNRTVERRLKEALKNDRARIQVGRISHFGLLEMSRQRMRTGVLEGSTVVCPHCAGTGHMRSTASIALHVLRALEDSLARGATHNVIVRARSEVALYILNHKRANLRDIEQRFGVSVVVAGDDTLTGAIYHAFERGEPVAPPSTFQRPTSVRIDSVEPPPDYAEPEEAEAAEDDEDVGPGHHEEAAAAGAENGDGAQDDSDPRRRRRRRRRRGRGERDDGTQAENGPQPPDTGLAFLAEIGGDLPPTPAGSAVSDGDVDENEVETFEVEAPVEAAERGGRARRSGRRRRGERGDRSEPRSPVEQGINGFDEATAEIASSTTPAEETVADEASAPLAATSDATPEPEAAEAAPRPEPAEPPPAYIARLPEAEVDPSRPKRSGWWQRAKQTFGGS